MFLRGRDEAGSPQANALAQTSSRCALVCQRKAGSGSHAERGHSRGLDVKCHEFRAGLWLSLTRAPSPSRPRALSGAWGCVPPASPLLVKMLLDCAASQTACRGPRGCLAPPRGMGVCAHPGSGAGPSGCRGNGEGWAASAGGDSPPRQEAEKAPELSGRASLYPTCWRGSGAQKGPSHSHHE